MKPIAVFRWAGTEGPGYFATFLDMHALPWQLIKIDDGETLPVDPTRFSGIVLMGGPMSVNDPLPWIPQTEKLIRAAIAADIPVLGHCLGGQLISKALGGTVSRAPVPELGWHPVSTIDSAATRDWFGDIRHFDTFQWHYETFSIPPGATRILESPYCANQAYVIGKHLGMQCHVEMTPGMIDIWCAAGKQELREEKPSVQSAEMIKLQTPEKLPTLSSVADRLYSRWIKGLKP